MRRPQCMTFYYHMYGATMSCVVIYIKRQGSDRLKPVWLKSENRGNQWLQGQVNINETGIYQVSWIVFFNIIIDKYCHVFGPFSDKSSKRISLYLAKLC